MSLWVHFNGGTRLMTQINGREALTMPFVPLIRWSPSLPWLVFFLSFSWKIMSLEKNEEVFPLWP